LTLGGLVLLRGLLPKVGKDRQLRDQQNTNDSEQDDIQPDSSIFGVHFLSSYSKPF